MNKHLGLDQKLTVLQGMDPLRKWFSLDDRRVCARCDRVISGRMIDVWQDSRGTYRLHCPTAGCPGAPRDWFYHGSTPGGVVARSKAPIIGFGYPQT